MSGSEQRFPGTGIKRVTIESFDGDVSVRWTAGDEIVVRGGGVEIDTGAETLEIEQVARGRLLGILGTESIAVELPETIAETRLVTRHGDVDLASPHGDVEARVDHGDVDARDGSGHLAFKVGAGDVAVETYLGDLEVQSGAGDVKLSAVEGAVTVQLGTGDVSLRGGAGDVAVKSGAGDVSVRDRRAGNVSVKNAAGDVAITGGTAGSLSLQTGMGDVSSSAALGLASHHIDTGAGDISIGVPRDLPARFEITTARGSVDSDVPLVTVGKRGPRSVFGRRLVGSVGEGEPRAEITVRALKGDVRLHWLDVPASRAPEPPSRPARPEAPGPEPIPMGSPAAPAAPAAPGAPGAPSPATGPEPAPTPTAATQGPAESEERAILAALAAGSLSVEEASRLLDALAKRR